MLTFIVSKLNISLGYGLYIWWCGTAVDTSEDSNGCMRCNLSVCVSICGDSFVVHLYDGSGSGDLFVVHIIWQSGPYLKKGATTGKC